MTVVPDIEVLTANDVTNPIEVLTAVHIAVHGQDSWTADPIEGDAMHTVQDVYYLAATVAGDDHSYESVRFTPSHDGDWKWDGFIFPSDGAWTLTLWRVGTGREGADESITTQAVTVAAAA